MNEMKFLLKRDLVFLKVTTQEAFFRSFIEKVNLAKHLAFALHMFKLQRDLTYLWSLYQDTM